MKLFVWDFHGVLEKGNDDAVVEITNLVLERSGYQRRMSAEESLSLSGARWHEYFSFLLPEASIDECLRLQATCFKISQNEPQIVAKYIRLNDHADHTLSTIQRSGHHQILISNTPERGLDQYVDVVGIEKYFPKTHRFGVDSHSQNVITKKHHLMEFLKNHGGYHSIVAIGDFPGDMALVERLSIPATSYLYSHPGRPHRQAKSHHKINDLRCVLCEILVNTP